MATPSGKQGTEVLRGAERRRGIACGLAIALAVSLQTTAFAQTTLYRNALAPAQNLWAATAGWSVSGTASKAAPTTVGTTDTLVFSNFWTPQQASGLAIWLDAADPNTVIGGTAADAVTAWNDKSGNGRNAVSGTSRPTYQTASQNGNNTLRFNSDAMQAPFVTDPNALTYFMVYQRNGNGDASGFEFYLDIGVSAATPSNSGRFAQLLTRANPNNPEDFASSVLPGVGPASITSSPLNNNWNLHASTGVLTTGSQSFSYAINGGVVGTTTGTGANRTGTPVYRIGAGGTWSNVDTLDTSNLRVNGTIAETLTYSTALSTADRQLVEGYLAWKWGTVSSLPGDHPYKSAAPTAASDTVYLGGNRSAAGLQFAAGATTLLGGTSGGAAADSLTLGAGGITASGLAGATTLGAASGGIVSLVVGANQAWTNDSASLLRAFNGVSRAAGDTTSRILTIAGSGSTQLDGVIADGGASGTLGLTKSGAGRLMLSAASTYTGATTISGGTLALGAAGSFANSTTITVGDADSAGVVLDLTAKTGAFSLGAGQTLGGGGTVRLASSGTLTVPGTFSPGNSPGLFIYDAGTTLLSGTTLMEIFGTSRSTASSHGDGFYDAVNVINGGILDFTGGTLQLAFDSLFADNTTFDLFSSLDTASLAGNFSNVSVSGSFYDGLTWNQTGSVWKSSNTVGGQSLEFDAGTGNLVIVPEPGSLALAGLGIAAAAALRRRRSS